MDPRSITPNVNRCMDGLGLFWHCFFPPAEDQKEDQPSGPAAISIARLGGRSQAKR